MKIASIGSPSGYSGMVLRCLRVTAGVNFNWTGDSSVIAGGAGEACLMVEQEKCGRTGRIKDE